VHPEKFLRIGPVSLWSPATGEEWMRPDYLQQERRKEEIQNRRRRKHLRSVRTKETVGVVRQRHVPATIIKMQRSSRAEQAKNCRSASVLTADDRLTLPFSMPLELRDVKMVMKNCTDIICIV